MSDRITARKNITGGTHHVNSGHGGSFIVNSTSEKMIEHKESAYMQALQ